MAKQSSTKRKIASAFHEVYENVPKNVKKTGKTGEAKHKMMTAIALSKARSAGADIPSMQRGGVVPETGMYGVHKGERVISFGDAKPVLSPLASEAPTSVPPGKAFSSGMNGSMEIETPAA